MFGTLCPMAFMTWWFLWHLFFERPRNVAARRALVGDPVLVDEGQFWVGEVDAVRRDGDRGHGPDRGPRRGRDRAPRGRDRGCRGLRPASGTGGARPRRLRSRDGRCPARSRRAWPWVRCGDGRCFRCRGGRRGRG